MKIIKEDINYKFEMLYPYILSIIPPLFFCNYLSEIKDKNLNEVFSIFTTVDTLMIGFIGTIVSILMSLKFDNELIKGILKDDRFKRYTKQSLVVGFISVILIIITLILTKNDSYKCFSDTMLYLCLYFMTVTFMTFYRFFKICLFVLFWEKNESEEDLLTRPKENEECRNLYRTKK